MRTKLFALATAIIGLTSCGNGAKTTAADTAKEQDNQNSENISMSTDTNNVKVEISTTMGDITVLLYGDTPKHRDNFVKLVKDGFYDGTLFHRVINEFMVQAGDPDSKTAKPGQHLGAGDMGYTIEAEIKYPQHFHKRGALAAARTGDQVNPERRSSGSQFYIVTGKAYSEAEMAQMEGQLTEMSKQGIFQQLVNERRAQIMDLQQKGDRAGLQKLQDELIAITEQKAAENPVKLTEEQKKAYTTVGGAPHLDNQYTVFGEVLSGMEVVDKIEKAETDSSDRPKEDIKIISMKIIE